MAKINRELIGPRCLLLATLLWTQFFGQHVLAQGRSSPDPQIPESSIVLSTAEVAQLRVVPVAHGLANPFDFAFRDNGDILVTERYTGNLRLIRNGELVSQAIPGVPEVYSAVFRAGLMSVVVHPDDDSVVYLTYTKGLIVNDEPEQKVALVRGLLQDNRLVDVEEIFLTAGYDRGIAASKLLFAPDRKLMMSVGGAYVYMGYGDYAQDPAVHYGKLLRLNDDGTPAADNPFIESGEYLPEVYSVGHRNQIGLSFNPLTGELWAAENGPQGGDEVNIIKAGANYGWPVVSYSRQYRGDWVSQLQQDANFISPEIIWWPSIAPSGMTFYDGDKFPQWQNNLFVGSMLEGRIPGSGHLERIEFNSRGEEVRRESLLRELKARISAVKQGPDGYLYVLVDEDEGALLRLEPVN
jgi:glucose/arabinose dehydrogenase